MEPPYLNILNPYSQKNVHISVLPDAKERGSIGELKPVLDMLIKQKISISKELYDHAPELAGEKE